MILLVALMACSGGDTETGDTAPGPVAGVVDLTTRDDVALKADWYPASTTGRPGVVLLHMTPTGNASRADWPVPFLDLLTARDWNVIAIDRRGGGESEGVATEAFQGDTGRYDVEAAVLKLDEMDLDGLAVVGASNGTTPMVDYAVWAGGEGLVEPTALAYLTGGTYTENQTAMADVPKVPAVFTFSTAERAWSVDQQPLDPGSWSFLEYADGAHGTRMFGAVEGFDADLDGFLGQHL